MNREDRESFSEWWERTQFRDDIGVPESAIVWGVLGLVFWVVFWVLVIHIPDSIRYAVRGRQERQQLPTDSGLAADKMTRCPHCPYLIPIDSQTCPHCEKPTGF